MKIICEEKYKEFLKEQFKPFEHLPFILIQDNSISKEPSIYFHVDQYKQIQELLKGVSIKDELIGEKNGRYYLLKCAEILFIESYSKDTFAYTFDDSYKIMMKITDLETNTIFTRISRTTLVNISYIKFVLPALSSKLILHLENNMEIEVNRAYLKQFKEKIGMKVKK